MRPEAPGISLVPAIRIARAAGVALALCSVTLTAAAAQGGAFEGAARILSMTSCDERLSERRANADSQTDLRLHCRTFRYEVDGLHVAGFLVAPAGPGPFPVVIFNRGGTADFGNVGIGLLAELPAMLADAGFLVIGSQYRGGTDAPAEVEGTDEWGGGDVDDVLALLDIVDSLEIADGEHVGLFGASRGTVNAFMAARQSDRFGAVVGFSGLYDLAAEAARRPRMATVWGRHMPDHPENPGAALRRRSVVEWVDELPAGLPILILHGAFDERASAGNALEFASRLHNEFARYKLVIYDADDHALTQNRRAAHEQTLDWFGRFLIDGASRRSVR